MSKLKKQNILLGTVATVAMILSIFGVVAAILSESLVARILIIICSVLLLILAFLYLLVIIISRDNIPNFFLYDEKTNRNISIEQLEYDAVASRLDEFVDRMGGADILMRRHGLENGNFGMGAILRPAVVYRLLYLSAQDDNVLELIKSSDNSAFQLFINCLEDVGDKDMASVIQRYRTGSVSGEKFKLFLGNNQKYIQGRTMAYISKNIERFY